MKSKKILTILLSLAIMFTFMPAMAFAAATETVGEVTYTAAWNDAHTSVTITGSDKSEYTVTDHIEKAFVTSVASQ